MLHHTTSPLVSTFTNSQNSIKHIFKCSGNVSFNTKTKFFLLNSSFIWHKEHCSSHFMFLFVCFVWQVSKDIRHIQRFEWKNCPFSSVSFGAFNSLTIIIISYQLLLTFNSSDCSVSVFETAWCHCFLCCTNSVSQNVNISINILMKKNKWEIYINAI